MRKKVKMKHLMAHIILMLCVLVFFMPAMGQEYRVESFEILPSDLTARTESRVDGNGRKCGVIKVYVKDVITELAGSAIGDVIDKGFEKRVYVAHDAKQIEIYFKEHMPLRVIFDDFNFTALSGNMTYAMKLTEVQNNPSESQWSSSHDTNESTIGQLNNTNDNVQKIDNPLQYKELAMKYVEENNLVKAAETYHIYVLNSDNPGYNDYLQEAVFFYWAGVETKPESPEMAERYFTETESALKKAAFILPDNYKPKKMMGDIAIQRAATDDKSKEAAKPYYEKAIAMLESSTDPKRYPSDAKAMYNYMGNYYLDRKDYSTAKKYYYKYLEYDPDNINYRKFVESLK